MLRRLPVAAAALTVALSLLPAEAAPAPAQVALAYNNDCVAPDGTMFVEGNCDGGGYVFTATTAVPKAGLVTLGGVPFRFPSTGAGQNNTLVATGQTVALPGKPGYRYLHVLGFVTNGNPKTSAVTITYSKGPKGTGSIRMADWTVKTGSVLAMKKHGPYNPVNSDVLPNTGYAFIATVALDPKRAVRSVTLPPGVLPSPTADPVGFVNGFPAQHQVFAMTLSASPQKKSGGPVFN